MNNEAWAPLLASRAWRDYARRAPDTVAPEIGLWSIPPLPDIPEDQHGAPVVIVAGVFIGAPAQSGPVLGPLRELGSPLADMSDTVPYVDSQSALDELFPDGGRYYWKSHFLNELTDEAIRAPYAPQIKSDLVTEVMHADARRLPSLPRLTMARRFPPTTTELGQRLLREARPRMMTSGPNANVRSAPARWFRGVSTTLLGPLHVEETNLSDTRETARR